jgi:C-terminal processing protease CtpA/Prc
MPGVPTLQKRRMPLNVRDCREGLIVSRVAGATQAADGPRVGDRLIAVNGSKMEDIVARSQSIVFGSTPGMRRALAVREALWIERESAQVDLEAPDGARRRVTLAAAAGVPDDLQPPRKGHPPALDWPRKRVARLTIPSFAVGDWGAWLKATVEQRDGFLVESKKQLDAALDAVVDGSAEALILDLRGNDGGTDLLGIHLAQRLLSEPFIYFRLSTKLNGKWLQPGGLTYQPRKRHVSARLVALVDEGVFSTADNLLRCLRDHRTDLVVVGRPTGAGTGAPREIARLPHSGAIVTLCTHRVFGPTSGLIEGAGTAPDVAVTWTRLDVIKNRDPDLNAALEDVRPSR